MLPSKEFDAYMGHVKEDFTDLISFFREYPDYFLDYIKTENTMFDLLPFQRVYLRAFARYKRLGIVASRGISKCVSGDTLIATKDGLQKIGDLASWSKEERIDLVDNQVVNIHGDLEYSDVIVSNGYKDTKVITTKNGYEIEGTHVHPLLVLSENGEMAFKTMSELEIGDKVGISRKGAFGNSVKIEYDNQDMFSKNGRKPDIKKVPKELTKDLAYFIGSIIGDGSMRQKNQVIFTTADDETVSFMTKFVKDSFGREFKSRNGKYDYVIYGKEIRHFLNSIGLDNVKSNEKKVPDLIFKAPREIVASFLQGLFDTDGTTTGRSISFSTSSEELGMQVQQLLLNFGIISNRQKRLNKKYNTYSHQIYILSNNVDIFNKEIGFRLTRKQNKLDEFSKIKRNSNENVIYYQSNRVERMINKSTLSSEDKKKFKHVIKGDNNLSYDKLGFIYENIDKFEQDEDLATLFGMYEDNLFWNPIVEIVDSKNYVYDFHVPETHTFIGNGFVNHNTYINVLANYIKCILYPNNSLCIAMPTKEQSAKVVKEKIEEYWRDYPLLKNELVLNKCQFQKDYVRLVFKNGSTLDTLTVGESSRGLRAQGISLEEIVDERMDAKTINEVIRPILAQPRMVVGHGVDKENEYSKTEAYVTTASHRQSYCYDKFASLFGEMVEGKPTIVLGTSYEMGTEFGTLDIEDVNEKMDDPTYSPLSFDIFYVA